MADDNKHITDSEKLLLYYKDKLSSEEKHRLEADMLDDPFMADAAEGLGMVSNPAMIDSYINTIQEKFTPAPVSPKNTFMQVVANTAAVAASVTLLIGAAYYISTYVNKKEPVVAEEKIKQPTKAPVTDGGQATIPALEEAQSNDTVIAGIPQVYRWEPSFSYNDATTLNEDIVSPIYKSVTDSVATSSSVAKVRAEEAPSLGNNYIYDTYGPASNNVNYSWNPNNQGITNENTKVVTKDKDKRTTKSSTINRNDNAAPQQPQADYINGVLVKPDNDDDFYSPPPPTAKELEDKRNKALAKALSSFNNGKYKDALSECETVLETDPANTKAIYYAGMACKQIGRKEKAIEYFNKIPSGNNYFESALWEKAQLYKTLKKKDLAISTLQDIIKLNGPYKTKAQTLLNELQGH